MSILICGASGTIGSQLTRELARRKLNVRGASRNPQALAALRAEGVETVRLDLEDPTTLRPALQGVQRLFLVGPAGPDFGERIKPVMRAARDAGVEFVLRYSALGANPQATFTLARQHGIGEAHVKASDIAWSVLQPTFYQDNLINFSGDVVRSQGKFYGASGAGKTAYVSSQDIVRCAAAILSEPTPHLGRSYVLTGPRALADHELAELASSVTGRTINYIDLPPQELGAAMAERGMPTWIVDSLVALEGVKRAGYAAEVSPAVEQITGAAGETYRSFLMRHRGKLA